MANTAIKMRSTVPVSGTYPFVLDPLPFAWDALEPHIDAETVRIHHEKHHLAYVTQLNAALKDYPEFHEFSIDELLCRLGEVPSLIRETVRNHGGGHANHQLFWKMLRPASERTRPSAILQEAIEREFGSLEVFKGTFVKTGVKHFGSGWVFLAMSTADGKLEVFSRPNQDSVLSERKTVLLINDLWEHAYYLKYRNARVDYLNAFWNVVNWDYVSQRFDEQVHTFM